MVAKFLRPETRVPLIDRPRLVDRMAAFAARKCTLLHAPAGGGKTYFLTQWLKQPELHRHQVFWISLDEQDADPQHFLATLAACVKFSFPASAAVALSDHIRAAAHTLWSAFLELSPQAIIILDDYHVAESQGLNALLGVLLERLPSGIHIVIASRSLPAVPIGRLRSQGQVLVIGSAELAFDAPESRAILQGHIPETKVEAVARELAGWPVLVQLVAINAPAGLDLRSSTEAIDCAWGDISSFVESEIMGRLSPEVRRAAIQTSVARTVTLDLASAICDREIDTDSYYALTRAFPVVPAAKADAGGFCHHPVISRYLQECLAALGHRMVTCCHQRAANWFLCQGDVAGAAFHMAATGDFDGIATLIENRGAVRIALIDGFPELVKLIELLPAETIMKRPRLRLAQAWIAAKNGNVAAARQWATAVQTSASSLPIDNTIKRESLFVDKMMWTVYEENSIGADALQEIEDIRALMPDDDQWFASWINNLLCVMYTRRGNLMAANEAAAQALTGYRMMGSLYGEVFMRGHQAMISIMSGRFGDAARQAEMAASLTEANFSADIGLSAMIDFLRGHIAYERNEFARARQLLAPALEKIGSAETWVELHALGAATLAKIHFEEDSREQAFACLDKLHLVGEQRGLRRLQWLAVHCRFELLLSAGERSHAQAWAECNDIFLAAAPSFATWFEGERAALARMHYSLVQADDRENLQERLEDFVEEAEALGHKRAAVEALILLSRLFHERHRHDDARASIERALALAVPEMMLRPFLENGAPLVAVLKSMIRSIGIKSLLPATLSFIIRIIAEAGGLPQGGSGASTMFSEKELEVLGDLVADKSNKMIARHLAISEATVKFHLANIYRKLGVNTRADAKTIARERRLVSE
ncbi:MAG TPA: LuxR C-terminal-related transcriptional regulator [Steroidobacter sp.]|uniref:LuxR C-terminal-related transcriptional regulator n=1 Tax=Steroidobacter sp. TaxID=1978227 RepID=UPI002ED86C1B